MICYVVIEHRKLLFESEDRTEHLARALEVKFKVEDITGDACLIQHYSTVTLPRLGEWGVRAVLISGNFTDWNEYAPGSWQELYRVIRDSDLPILGFCGGCQLIGRAFGAPLGPLRPLAEDEPDPQPEFGCGYFKEWGFMPVQVCKFDPLFDGLGDKPVFLQAHYWEIKQAPPEFEILAASDECQIQVIKHRRRPIYGTQFHPEAYDPEHPDGHKLLANFFKVAGILS